MARVEITVAGLVPAPVAAVEVPGAPALNAKLQHLIPQRRDATSGLLAFSSGGRHSDRETVVWLSLIHIWCLQLEAVGPVARHG